jgi:hypothetical protein
MTDPKNKEDDKKKKFKEDLDKLTRFPTSIFKKSDFEKMLGNDAQKKSEDMINDIYKELEKKKKDGKGPEKK